MVAARLCWRAGAVRPPTLSSRPPSSRLAISAALIPRIRAAASSMASGSPSSCRQMSAMAGASSRPGRKPGWLARARNTNSVPASSAGNGSTGCSCSPSMPSGSRLVASTATSGQCRISRPTSSSRRIEHVFAVVQHQQQRARLQVGEHGLLDGQPVSLLHLQRRGQRVGHRTAVAERRQLAQPGAVGESVPLVPGDLHGQPRLADPADPGEGDQRRVGQGRGDVVDLPAAADEPGRPARQVATRRGRQQPRIVTEDLLVERLRGRRRQHPQLVVEPLAQLVVGRQGVGLAAARVAGPHQPDHGLLAGREATGQLLHGRTPPPGGDPAAAGRPPAPPRRPGAARRGGPPRRRRSRGRRTR